MKRLGVLLTLSALLISCTEKGKPYYKHEEDTSPRPGVSTTGTPATEAPLPPYDDAMETLAARVLNPEYIRNPEAMTARKAHDELIRLNRAILAVPEAERAKPEFQKLLRDYAAALQTDCGRFASNCKGLMFFDRAPSSAQVAKLVAKAVPGAYYKMLFYALKLKPVGWDPEIGEMLLRKPEGADEVAYAQAMQNMLELDLQSIQKRSNNRAENRRFLESIHGWELLSKREWANSDTGSNTLIAMLADAGMLYDDNGAIHPGLKKLIEEQSRNPKGYMAMQKSLQENKALNAESIGIKFIPEMDELLYIVDSVYSLKMNYDSGIRLFAASKRTAEELESVTRNYLSLQFVNSLTESTIEAKEIFNAKIPIEDLLIHVVRESARIEQVWSRLNTRVMPLQTFVISAARARPGSDAVQSNLRTLFQSINRSISLSSVYPMHLVLFHILGQKKFDVYFPDGVKRDSAELIRGLFDQKITNVFRYGESGTQMNQLELLHAVDMAIRTNLMGAAGVEPDEFISSTIWSLSEPHVLKVTGSLTMVSDRLGKSSTYESFAQACEEFKTGTKRSRQIYLTELSQSAYYGKLLPDAFTGLASGAAGNVAGIMYMDSEFSEMLESARLDLSNSLRAGEAMLASYTSYLRLTGAKEEAIAAKTKRTQTQLKRLKDLRLLVLNSAKEWFREIGFCYWQAAERDAEISQKILSLEAEYVREIYKKLTRLRDPSISAQEAEQIRASIRLKNLPSDFTGLDEFVADGLTYSDVDFFFRVAGYLKQIAPHVMVYPGTKLDRKTTAIKDAKRFTLRYTPSEEDFVNQAMLILTTKGYASWQRANVVVGSWEKIVSSQMSLYRLEHDIFGRTDESARLDILEMQSTVLRYMAISPWDRYLLQIKGGTYKVSASQLDGQLLTWDNIGKRISGYWGLFDFPVLMSQQEELGKGINLGGYKASSALNAGKNEGLQVNTASSRLTYLTAGTEYYKVRAARLTSVLPFSAELDKFMNRSIRTFVQGEIRSIAEFKQTTDTYLKKISAMPTKERPRADITIFDGYTDPLLKSTVQNDWDSMIQRFHQGTGQCFAKDSCPQFDTFK